jgi:hypothetical protein
VEILKFSLNTIISRIQYFFGGDPGFVKMIKSYHNTGNMVKQFQKTRENPSHMNKTKAYLSELTKGGDFGSAFANCSSVMPTIREYVCQDLKACNADPSICNYFSYFVDYSLTILGACDVPLSHSLEVFTKVDKLV